MDESDFEYSGRTLRWYEWLAIALLLFYFIGAAHAGDVYQCTDARGAVAFQATPCAPAQRGSVVELHPPPAHAESPKYALDDTAHASKTSRSATTAYRNAATSGAASYECRSADGQVFYRHTRCPHSIAAMKVGKARDRGTSTSVGVSSIRVSREQACEQIRRAGAAGRSGHRYDEDVSTYDKNVGRDPCR